MKHLHIMNTDKFVEPYIKFINKHFNFEEHQFLSFLSGDADFIEGKYSNLIKYRKVMANKTLLKKMKAADQIYLHSLFDLRIVFMLFICPWFLKKCYWIIWGGDLYSYRQPRTTIKSKMIECLRASVFKRIGHIITLVKGDYDLARDWYKVSGIYFHGEYPDIISKEYLDCLPKRKKKSNTINILLGNSADPSNHHLDALDKLIKFKDENIKIYAPLSYGDSNYASKVIQKGSDIFGDKFIGMTDFLTPYKYYRFLNTMDIAIFNNDRQQALGNIFALIYLNKKIFLRSDTTMWSEFENRSIEMNDFISIDNLKFEEFILLGDAQREKVESAYDQASLIPVWEKIFSKDNISVQKEVCN